MNTAADTRTDPDSGEQEWDLTIATPIGRQLVMLRLREGKGTLEGEARSKDEAVPLEELARDGDHLTWSQSITRPMRLNLRFDVAIEGDTITGTSKAGGLPTSRVNGTRRALR